MSAKIEESSKKVSKIHLLLVLIVVLLPAYGILGAFGFDHMVPDFYSAKASQDIALLSTFLSFSLMWISGDIKNDNSTGAIGFVEKAKNGAPVIIVIVSIVILIQTIKKANQASRIESAIQRAELVVPENGQEAVKVKQFKYLYLKNFEGKRWKEIEPLYWEIDYIADKNYPNGLSVVK